MDGLRRSPLNIRWNTVDLGAIKAYLENEKNILRNEMKTVSDSITYLRIHLVCCQAQLQKR